MSEDPTKAAQPATKAFQAPWYLHLAQPLAILFWSYAITQVFVFNLDGFLQSKLHFWGWIVEFKFPFFLGIVALVWSITKSTEVLLWFLYISLYPLIIVVWKIPRFIWKQRSWNLTFAYVNTILSTAKSLKYGVLIFALIVIETLLIIDSSTPPFIWLSIGLCLITIVATFFHRFVLIFRPSVLYQTHSKLVSSITNFGKRTWTVEASIKELPAETKLQQMDLSQRTKWANNLQWAIIMNRGCKFLSRKIEEYQRSKLTALFYALNFLILMAISILMFTLMNFGIFKIDPSNFVVSVKPGFFIFFY